MVRCNAFLLTLSALLACGSTKAQFEVGGIVSHDPDQAALFACAYSADGRYLVTGGDSIRVFHTRTGQLLQQLRPVLGPRPLEAGDYPLRQWIEHALKRHRTRRIAFSPVIKDLFATANDDGAIRLWRVSSAKPIHVLPGHIGYITELAFSPDGRRLVSGSSIDKRLNSVDDLRLWDVVTGASLRTEHFYNDGVKGLSFLDNDTLVFANNDDKERRGSVVEFYDVTNWSRKRQIAFSPGGAFSVLVTPARDRLILTGGQCVPLGPGSCRPTGYLWIADLADDQPPVQIKTPPRGYFCYSKLVPGDRFVTKTDRVGRGVTDHLEMRSCIDGRLLWSAHCTDGVLDLAVAPAGDQIAYCGGSAIVFLDVDTGQEIRRIEVGI